jgi:hypothetical protein
VKFIGDRLDEWLMHVRRVAERVHSLDAVVRHDDAGILEE